MVKKSKVTMASCCVLVAFLLVVIFLQASYAEGFASCSSNIDQVSNSTWVADAEEYNSIVSTKRSDYKGTTVPLRDENLFYFKDNQFKPECCPATYSNSTGCACMSTDQKNYLNERGGNRTFSTNF